MTTFRLVRWSCLGALCAGWLLGAARAHAQTPSITLNRYAPAETPDDDFHLSRARDLGHLRLGAQFQLDYASDPLVWESVLGDSESERAVVGDQLTGTLGLAFGAWNRLVVYAGLPAVLLMDGMTDAEADRYGFPGADGGGLGDAYLGARVRLVGEADDVGALALQGTLTLPTAGATGTHAFRGDDTVTAHPELLAEVRPGLIGSRIVLNVGALIREQAAGPRNLEVESELTVALGLGIPVWTDRRDADTHVDLMLQSNGSTAFGNFFTREHSPMQGMAGARFSHASGWRVGAAFGVGLLPGLGTPDTRAVLSLGYLAKLDELPREPEETAEIPPPVELDSDGDGVLDGSDRCASEAEDADGFEDDDGCADPDNDGDGLLDTGDRCPTQAGAADNGGCPDTDSDGDGVVDRLDACPEQVGVAEERGCAAPQKVVVSPDRIEIKEQVRFGSNSAEILSDSHELLMNVAQVLKAHPEITKVRIEGHSDTRGNADKNLALSRRRAQAVLEFLATQGGVERQRMEAEGYGSSRTLVPAASTPEEHEQNRRVEFHIVTTEGGQP